jgi:hypothetical protein
LPANFMMRCTIMNLPMQIAQGFHAVMFVVSCCGAH